MKSGRWLAMTSLSRVWMPRILWSKAAPRGERITPNG